MKVLVLAGDTPATASMPGSPRLVSLCRGLARRHELHLATRRSSEERHRAFLDDPEVARIFAHVRVLPSPSIAPPRWWNKQRHRACFGAFTETRYLHPDYHEQLVDAIRAIVRRELMELVYVDGLAMTQYIDASIGVPAIVDLHDSSTMLLSRMIKVEPTLKRKVLLSIDRIGIRKWEASLYKSFGLIITNSEVDEAEVRRLARGTPTLTIGNGVDADFFAPAGRAPHPERLIFTGVMNYSPNEDAVVYFCEEIFPVVRAQQPSAEFWIVGKDPTPTVQALSRHTNVHVTGGVPDMRPYLEEAGIFVCPLRYGAGIKNKILAALAMRKPVIATRVSIDGLDLVDNRELLVADGPGEFAAKIVTLLQQPGRAQQLADAGQRLVTAHYSWPASADRLATAIDDVMASSSAAPRRSAE